MSVEMNHLGLLTEIVFKDISEFNMQVHAPFSHFFINGATPIRNEHHCPYGNSGFHTLVDIEIHK
jgi:hypothetical protein